MFDPKNSQHPHNSDELPSPVPRLRLNLLQLGFHFGLGERFVQLCLGDQPCCSVVLPGIQFTGFEGTFIGNPWKPLCFMGESPWFPVKISPTNPVINTAV